MHARRVTTKIASSTEAFGIPLPDDATLCQKAYSTRDRMKKSMSTCAQRLKYMLDERGGKTGEQGWNQRTGSHANGGVCRIAEPRG